MLTRNGGSRRTVSSFSSSITVPRIVSIKGRFLDGFFIVQRTKVLTPVLSSPDILLNLFIAIILEHFELDDDEKYKKQLEMYFETHQKLKTDKTKEFFQ